MHTDQPDIIQEKLSALSQDQEFLDTFYDLLFAKSDTAQKSFQDVDMEVQKRKLGAALPKFLSVASQDADSQAVLAANARHAKHHGGRRQLDYGTWIETLCQAFRQHEPQLTKSMESLLRERLQIAVSHLTGDQQ